jgi:hypothetical protein
MDDIFIQTWNGRDGIGSRVKAKKPVIVAKPGYATRLQSQRCKIFVV